LAADSAASSADGGAFVSAASIQGIWRQPATQVARRWQVAAGEAGRAAGARTWWLVRSALLAKVLEDDAADARHLVLAQRASERRSMARQRALHQAIDISHCTDPAVRVDHSLDLGERVGVAGELPGVGVGEELSERIVAVVRPVDGAHAARAGGALRKRSPRVSGCLPATANSGQLMPT